MIKIYLTRHGETLENAQGILQGHLPGHLSELGKKQALHLRNNLTDTHFDSIIVSNLKRAIDTAQIFNEQFDLPVIQTPLLSERNWGEFTGVHITDIHVRPADFPPGVETPQELQQRAHQFLKFLLENFEKQALLIIGHGYFNRCIMAEIYDTSPHDIPRWGNTEIRKFTLSKLSKNNLLPQQDGEVSVN